MSSHLELWARLPPKQTSLVRRTFKSRVEAGMPDTEYYCTVVNGVPVVTTPEEIDIMTSEKLRAVLVEAAGGGPVVVVDMTGTTFLDSSGLHVLLGAHRQARSDGHELRLAVSPGGAVDRIFTLTGTDGILLCFQDVEEALADRVIS